MISTKGISENVNSDRPDNKTWWTNRTIFLQRIMLEKLVTMVILMILLGAPRYSESSSSSSSSAKLTPSEGDPVSSCSCFFLLRLFFTFFAVSFTFVRTDFLLWWSSRSPCSWSFPIVVTGLDTRLEASPDIKICYVRIWTMPSASSINTKKHRHRPFFFQNAAVLAALLSFSLGIPVCILDTYPWNFSGYAVITYKTFSNSIMLNMRVNRNDWKRQALFVINCPLFITTMCKVGVSIFFWSIWDS